MSIVRRRRGFPVDSRTCRRLLRWLAARMGCRDASCTLLLCDDAEMEALNRRHLRRAHPTDVLAFPGTDPPSAHGYLGDIAISLDTARRQASRCNRSLQKEVDRLLLHGFLHLLGFDHETDGGEMRRRERTLWRAWLAGRPASRSRTGPALGGRR